MADIEKTHDLSEDPEKVPYLSHQPTNHEGEIKVATKLKHVDPNDGDEALKAFVGHEGETIVMTPEMERKLLRKIDLNLMPVRLTVSKLSFARCPPCC
jgi:ACS family allantoate permease-like MFS transporter